MILKTVSSEKSCFQIQFLFSFVWGSCCDLTIGEAVDSVAIIVLFRLPEFYWSSMIAGHYIVAFSPKNWQKIGILTSSFLTVQAPPSPKPSTFFLFPFFYWYLSIDFYFIAG